MFSLVEAKNMMKGWQFTLSNNNVRMEMDCYFSGQKIYIDRLFSIISKKKDSSITKYKILQLLKTGEVFV